MHYLYVLYVLVVSWTHMVLAEVISLVEGGKGICVLTGDSIYSAIYVTRNSTNDKIDFRPRLLELNVFWVNDDWNEVNSSVSSLPFVTDIRWENFREDNTNSFLIRDDPVYFSICTKNKFRYIVKQKYDTIKNIDLPHKINVTEQLYCEWFHYIALRNKTLLEIKSKDDDEKIQIETGSNNYVSMSNDNHANIRKRHNMSNIKKSNTISKNSSYIEVNFKENACIAMYVYVEENCYLDVTLQIGDNKMHQRINETYSNKLQKWRKLELKTDVNGTGKIYFLRGRFDDKKVGFWAIDAIHECKTNIDLVHFSVPPDNSNEHHFCRSLVTNINSINQTFCEKTGFIGTKCDISCATIFPTQPDCKGHKICLENGTCRCAWGYEEPYCNISQPKPTTTEVFLTKSTDESDTTIQVHSTTTTDWQTFAERCVSQTIYKCPVENPDLPPSFNSKNHLELFWTIENELEFKMTYPVKPKTGNLSFTVTIIQGPKGQNKTSYNYDRSTKVFSKQKIGHQFFPSTNYTINIEGGDNFYVSRNVISPPNIPFLEVEPEINSTKSSIIIEISPKIENMITTNNYSLFILMEDENGDKGNNVRKELGQMEDQFHIDLSEFRLLYKCNLKKLNTTKFLICNVSHEIRHCHNYDSVSLKENTVYNITIILRNMDCYNGSSYKVYSYTKIIPTIQEAASRKYVFLLLVLLLFLLIGGVVMGWKTYIKKNVRDTTENFPLTSGVFDQRTYLHQDDDSGDYAHFSKPVSTELFENYVRNGIENKTFIKQYEKIMNIVENEFYERPPGNFFWDYVDVDFEEDQKRTYIISELPSDDISEQFLLSIWNENVENIVLVTDAFDNNQQEVIHKHFPEDGNSLEYENISVQWISSTRYFDYKQQTFKISCNQTDREINLLSFISWTNNSVISSFIITPFMKEMLRICQTSTSPLAVISSGDMGAVGFILLCAISLLNGEKYKNVDVVKTFFTLAKYKMNMTIVQYILAHLIILENLMSVDTNINCQNFDTNESLLTNENVSFYSQHLKKVYWIDDSIVRIKQDARIHYNMSSSVYEPENHHEYIYIDKPNITIIDISKSLSKFITTSKPGKHSLFNFWKLIKENNVTAIVSLNESSISRKEIWWPNEEGYAFHLSKNLHVKNQATKRFQDYTWVTVNLEVEETQHIVEIFLFKNWSKKNDCPDSVDDFVNFFIETNKISKNSNPLIVICCDGKKASGLYLAFSYVVEKINLEGTCDVCSAVRFIKTHHSEFLKSDVQFKFLWQAADFFLKETRTYETVY